jgi:enoyl-CoA hydratase/carnithine racemase
MKVQTTGRPDTVAAMGFEAIKYETDGDHVATITLNRPEALNSFNRVMLDEFRQVWAEIRADFEVNAVVVRAEGRAFSAGIDVKDRSARATAGSDNPFNDHDPGSYLGPKANQVWKPVICAVHGIAAGGALYWVNEADIVICSEDAQFFDPHVTYGMTSSLEPIGLSKRIPLGEALRWALMGLDERIGAERALQIGLVSEVTARDDLWPRAHEIASLIAAKPSVATQGTVKAIWESLDVGRTTALQRGLTYTQLGNPLGGEAELRGNVARPTPRIR